MFASTIVRGALSRGLLTVRSQVHQRAGVTSGPPTKALTSSDMWIAGGGILVGVMGIPVWILINLKKYQGLDESTEE